MSTTLYSNNPCQIIIWARKAKLIYVPLLGTGGAEVKVNKADFIKVMGTMQNPLEKEYAFQTIGGILYA